MDKPENGWCILSVCGRTVDRHIQCSIQYMIISIVNVTINISPVPFILITGEITAYSISRTQYLIEVIGCVARIGPIVFLQVVKICTPAIAFKAWRLLNCLL